MVQRYIVLWLFTMSCLENSVHPTQASLPVLEDTQAQPAPWPIAIDAVGVCGLRLPLLVPISQGGAQQVTATVTLSANLGHDTRGAHMSRFIEVLEAHRETVLTPNRIMALLEQLRLRLQANAAELRLEFAFFLPRHAPHTAASALMDYDCEITAACNSGAGSTEAATSRYSIGVTVPMAALCPCSKAISDYGAHNQRGRLRMEITPRGVTTENDREVPAIEECVAIAENAGSSPVYPLLKRADERLVTMQMYENPVFVEDMARSAAHALMADARVQAFTVHAETLESIHNHNAFASITWERPE